MTDTENILPPPKPRGRNEWLWLAFALLVAAGLVVAAFFMPMHGDRMSIGGNGPLPEKMMDMERRIHTLEDRAAALDARLDSMSETPPSKEQGRILSAIDLAHMQNDLAQLAVTAGNLQDQMKQSGTANQALAHMALAKMVAYIQLHDAAESDHGFTHELDAMRIAAKDDAGLKQRLDRLSPNAEMGAPTIDFLREQLAEHSAAIEVANAKAGAQTWWERILAEFRGLVLIRPVNGSGSQDNGLEPMKAALAQDDLAGALDAMKGLPPQAQEVLAEWREQAQARLSIGKSLRAISDYLVAGDAASAPEAAPAVPTQDKDMP